MHVSKSTYNTITRRARIVPSIVIQFCDEEKHFEGRFLSWISMKYKYSDLKLLSVQTWPTDSAEAEGEKGEEEAHAEKLLYGIQLQR